MSEFTVNRAILHIYDFLSGNVGLSTHTLNMEDKWVSGYITQLVKKCHTDMRKKQGEFSETSKFHSLLTSFAKEEMNFVEYSKQCSEQIGEYLKSTDNQSYDIVLTDYRVDDVPFIGVYLLENQKAYTHFSGADIEGNLENTIMYHSCVLPSASKKIGGFALINTLTHGVSYVDEIKWTLGEVEVMKDLILECTSEKSCKEVLSEVEEVVKEVAVACDENPTILLSRYKNYVSSGLEENDTISTEDLAANVFSDSEKLQDTFISTTLEHEIPKEVSVPSPSVKRSMKNQKIKTDTGIELTFPTEYFENPNMIEFINHENGTISIEIKNIGKITNRK